MDANCSLHTLEFELKSSTYEIVQLVYKLEEDVGTYSLQKDILHLETIIQQATKSLNLTCAEKSSYAT